MTTYELFLCWIIAMLLVLVVGEPDDRFHRCAYPLWAPIANEFDSRPAWKSTPATRCFFAP
jgi:hypothetical protein